MADAVSGAGLRAASINRCCSPDGRLLNCVAKSANCCGVILRASVTASASGALEAPGAGKDALSSPVFNCSPPPEGGVGGESGCLR